MPYVPSRISLDGLNEAVAGLKAMGAESELKALNFEVGKIVADEAKTIVPVLTGNLRQSIQPSKTAKYVIVRAGRDPIVPYANPINWGWFFDRKRNIKKNIKPTQFMNKAANKKRDSISTMYITKLIALFESKAKKG